MQCKKDVQARRTVPLENNAFASNAPYVISRPRITLVQLNLLPLVPFFNTLFHNLLQCYLYVPRVVTLLFRIILLTLVQFNTQRLPSTTSVNLLVSEQPYWSSWGLRALLKATSVVVMLEGTSTVQSFSVTLINLHYQAK